MADEPTIMLAPEMRSLTRNVVVRQPAGYLVAPQPGRLGGVSVGASHMETVGAVFHIGLHDADGTTLIATIGAQGFNMFARMVNDAADRIASGDFAQPEAMQ